MTAAAPKNIPMKSIVVQAYLWLAVPVAIFLAAWIRPIISIPLLIGLVWALAAIFRKNTDSPLFRSEGFDRSIRRDRTLIWMALIVVGMLIWCGMGGFISQYFTDAKWRNAVAYDLVKLPWPVEYPPLDGEPRIMSYYFGFWLPSSLIAKLTGGSLLVESIFQILYAAWGVCIILAFLFSFCHGRRRWLALLLFLFFSGWDIPGALMIYSAPEQSFIDFISNDNENYARYYFLQSTQVMLIHIYNMAIPATFGFLLLYFQRHRPELTLLTYALIFFFAPLACIGLFPVMAVWTLKNFRTSISWYNLLALALGFLFAAFFMANNQGTKLALTSEPASLMKIPPKALIWLLLDVAVFLPFIWREVRRNWVFWTLLATTLVAPVLTTSGRPELGWRASTPLAVMLMVLAVRKAVEIRNWRRPRNILFALVLAVGALEPVATYSLRGYFEVTRVITGGESPRDTTLEGHLADKDRNVFYNNFISGRDSFFRKHLMRR